MKYLVIGLVILALLLATAIGAVSLLENRAGQIVQELRLAEQALDQDAPELASDYARKAMDLWQRYSGFLGSFYTMRRWTTLTSTSPNSAETPPPRIWASCDRPAQSLSPWSSICPRWKRPTISISSPTAASKAHRKKRGESQTSWLFPRSFFVSEPIMGTGAGFPSDRSPRRARYRPRPRAAAAAAPAGLWPPRRPRRSRPRV